MRFAYTTAWALIFYGSPEFLFHQLEESLTVRNYLTVKKEDKRNVSRNLYYYNLHGIISVGTGENQTGENGLGVKEMMIKVIVNLISRH